MASYLEEIKVKISGDASGLNKILDQLQKTEHSIPIAFDLGEVAAPVKRALGDIELLVKAAGPVGIDVAIAAGSLKAVGKSAKDLKSAIDAQLTDKMLAVSLDTNENSIAKVSGEISEAVSALRRELQDKPLSVRLDTDQLAVESAIGDILSRVTEAYREISAVSDRSGGRLKINFDADSGDEAVRDARVAIANIDAVLDELSVGKLKLAIGVKAQAKTTVIPEINLVRDNYAELVRSASRLLKFSVGISLAVNQDAPKLEKALRKTISDLQAIASAATIEIPSSVSAVGQVPKKAGTDNADETRLTAAFDLLDFQDTASAFRGSLLRLLTELQDLIDQNRPKFSLSTDTDDIEAVRSRLSAFVNELGKELTEQAKQLLVLSVRADKVAGERVKAALLDDARQSVEALNAFYDANQVSPKLNQTALKSSLTKAQTLLNKQKLSLQIDLAAIAKEFEKAQGITQDIQASVGITFDPETVKASLAKVKDVFDSEVFEPRIDLDSLKIELRSIASLFSDQIQDTLSSVNFGSTSSSLSTRTVDSAPVSLEFDTDRAQRALEKVQDIFASNPINLAIDISATQEALRDVNEIFKDEKILLAISIGDLDASFTAISKKLDRFSKKLTKGVTPVVFPISFGEVSQSEISASDLTGRIKLPEVPPIPIAFAWPDPTALLKDLNTAIGKLSPEPVIVPVVFSLPESATTLSSMLLKERKTIAGIENIVVSLALDSTEFLAELRKVTGLLEILSDSAVDIDLNLVDALNAKNALQDIKALSEEINKNKIDIGLTPADLSQALESIRAIGVEVDKINQSNLDRVKREIAAHKDAEESAQTLAKVSQESLAETSEAIERTTSKAAKSLEETTKAVRKVASEAGLATAKIIDVASADIEATSDTLLSDPSEKTKGSIKRYADHVAKMLKTEVEQATGKVDVAITPSWSKTKKSITNGELTAQIEDAIRAGNIDGIKISLNTDNATDEIIAAGKKAGSELSAASGKVKSDLEAGGLAVASEVGSTASKLETTIKNLAIAAKIAGAGARIAVDATATAINVAGQAASKAADEIAVRGQQLGNFTADMQDKAAGRAMEEAQAAQVRAETTARTAGAAKARALQEKEVANEIARQDKIAAEEIEQIKANGVAERLRQEQDQQAALERLQRDADEANFQRAIAESSRRIQEEFEGRVRLEEFSQDELQKRLIEQQKAAADIERLKNAASSDIVQAELDREQARLAAASGVAQNALDAELARQKDVHALSLEKSKVDAEIAQQALKNQTEAATAEQKLASERLRAQAEFDKKSGDLSLKAQETANKLANADLDAEAVRFQKSQDAEQTRLATQNAERQKEIENKLKNDSAFAELERNRLIALEDLAQKQLENKQKVDESSYDLEKKRADDAFNIAQTRARNQSELEEKRSITRATLEKESLDQTHKQVAELKKLTEELAVSAKKVDASIADSSKKLDADISLRQMKLEHDQKLANITTANRLMLEGEIVRHQQHIDNSRLEITNRQLALESEQRLINFQAESARKEQEALNNQAEEERQRAKKFDDDQKRGNARQRAENGQIQAESAKIRADSKAMLEKTTAEIATAATSLQAAISKEFVEGQAKIERQAAETASMIKLANKELTASIASKKSAQESEQAIANARARAEILLAAATTNAKIEAATREQELDHYKRSAEISAGIEEFRADALSKRLDIERQNAAKIQGELATDAASRETKTLELTQKLGIELRKSAATLENTAQTLADQIVRANKELDASIEQAKTLTAANVEVLRAKTAAGIRIESERLAAQINQEATAAQNSQRLDAERTISAERREDLIAEKTIARLEREALSEEGRQNKLAIALIDREEKHLARQAALLEKETTAQLDQANRKTASDIDAQTRLTAGLIEELKLKGVYERTEIAKRSALALEQTTKNDHLQRLRLDAIHNSDEARKAAQAKAVLLATEKTFNATQTREQEIADANRLRISKATDGDAQKLAQDQQNADKKAQAEIAREDANNRTARIAIQKKTAKELANADKAADLAREQSKLASAQKLFLAERKANAALLAKQESDALKLAQLKQSFASAEQAKTFAAKQNEIRLTMVASAKLSAERLKSEAELARIKTASAKEVERIESQILNDTRITAKALEVAAQQLAAVVADGKELTKAKIGAVSDGQATKDMILIDESIARQTKAREESSSRIRRAEEKSAATIRRNDQESVAKQIQEQADAEIARTIKLAKGNALARNIIADADARNKIKSDAADLTTAQRTAKFQRETQEANDKARRAGLEEELISAQKLARLKEEHQNEQDVDLAKLQKILEDNERTAEKFKLDYSAWLSKTLDLWNKYYDNIEDRQYELAQRMQQDELDRISAAQKAKVGAAREMAQMQKDADDQELRAAKLRTEEQRRLNLEQKNAGDFYTKSLRDQKIADDIRRANEREAQQKLDLIEKQEKEATKQLNAAELAEQTAAELESKKIKIKLEFDPRSTIISDIKSVSKKIKETLQDATKNFKDAYAGAAFDLTLNARSFAKTISKSAEEVKAAFSSARPDKYGVKGGTPPVSSGGVPTIDLVLLEAGISKLEAFRSGMAKIKEIAEQTVKPLRDQLLALQKNGAEATKNARLAFDNLRAMPKKDVIASVWSRGLDLLIFKTELDITGAVTAIKNLVQKKPVIEFTTKVKEIGLSFFKGMGGKAASAFNDGWMELSNELGQLVRNAVGGVVESIDAFSKISAAAQSIASTSGKQVAENSEQMTTFKKAAVKAAADSTQTLESIAEFSTKLGRSGLSFDEITKTMGGLAIAADSTGEDIDKLGNLVASQKGIYQLSVDDLQKLSAAFAVAGTSASYGQKGFAQYTTTFQQYYKSQQKGVEGMKDAIKMQLMFAKVGAAASTAGTGTRAVIDRLASPTKQSGKAFEELNSRLLEAGKSAIVFKDAAGNWKNQPELIADIGVAFNDLKKEMGEVDATGLFSKAFQTQGLAAIQSASKGNREEIKKMFAEVDQAVSTGNGEFAANIKSVLDQGLSGAKRQYASAVETFQGSLGFGFEGIANFGIRQVTKIVESLSDERILAPLAKVSTHLLTKAEDTRIKARLDGLQQDFESFAIRAGEELASIVLFWGELILDPPEGLTRFIDNLQTIAGNIQKTLLPLLKTTASTLGDIASQQVSNLAQTSNYLTKGMGTAPTGDDGAAALGASALNRSIPIAGNIVNDLNTNFQASIASFLNDPATTQILKDVTTLFADLMSAAEPVLDVIGRIAFSVLIEGLGGAFMRMIQPISQVLTVLGKFAAIGFKILGIIGQVVLGTRDVNGAAKNSSEKFDSTIKVLDQLSNYLTTLSTRLDDTEQFIAEFSLAWQQTVTDFKNFPTWLGELFSAPFVAGAAAVYALQDDTNAVAASIRVAWQYMTENIRGFFQRIGASYRAIVASIAEQTMKSVLGFKNAWNNTRTWFSSIGAAFSNTFAVFRTNVANIALNASASFRSAWEATKKYMLGLVTGIGNAFRNVFKAINNALAAVRTAFLGAINSIRNGFAGAASNLQNNFAGALQSVRNKAIEIKNIFLGWIEPLKNAADRLSNFGSSVTSKGARFFQNLPGFAQGGVLPGYSPVDNVLAMLRSGEGILTPEAVKLLGGEKSIDALNSGNIPRFAAGGVVGASYKMNRDDYQTKAILDAVAKITKSFPKLQKVIADLASSVSSKGLKNSAQGIAAFQKELSSLTVKQIGAIQNTMQKTVDGFTAPDGRKMTEPAKAPGYKEFLGVKADADYFLLSAVAITEGLASSTQSQIDTLAAIGNRVQSGIWGDLRKTLLAPGQFEAVTKFGLAGIKTETQLRQKLAQMGYASDAFDKFEKALKGTSALKDAVDFIKGSTDYRANNSAQTAKARAGDPLRNQNDNYYIPGGTSQASVTAGEAAALYRKGQELLRKSAQGSERVMSDAFIASMNAAFAGIKDLTGNTMMTIEDVIKKINPAYQQAIRDLVSGKKKTVDAEMAEAIRSALGDVFDKGVTNGQAKRKYKIQNPSGSAVQGLGDTETHHDYQRNARGEMVKDFTLVDHRNRDDVEVPSAIAGKVIKAWHDAGGFGNAVVVKRLEDGAEVLMGHLKSLAVKEGDTVRKGQSLGIQGSTGGSSGVHLHMEASDKIMADYLKEIGSTGDYSEQQLSVDQKKLVNALKAVAEGSKQLNEAYEDVTDIYDSQEYDRAMQAIDDQLDSIAKQKENFTEDAQVKAARLALETNKKDLAALKKKNELDLKSFKLGQEASLASAKKPNSEGVVDTAKVNALVAKQKIDLKRKLDAQAESLRKAQEQIDKDVERIRVLSGTEAIEDNADKVEELKLLKERIRKEQLSGKELADALEKVGLKADELGLAVSEASNEIVEFERKFTGQGIKLDPTTLKKLNSAYEDFQKKQQTTLSKVDAEFLSFLQSQKMLNIGALKPGESYIKGGYSDAEEYLSKSKAASKEKDMQAAHTHPNFLTGQQQPATPGFDQKTEALKRLSSAGTARSPLRIKLETTGNGQMVTVDQVKRLEDKLNSAEVRDELLRDLVDMLQNDLGFRMHLGLG